MFSVSSSLVSLIQVLSRFQHSTLCQLYVSLRCCATSPLYQQTSGYPFSSRKEKTIGFVLTTKVFFIETKEEKVTNTENCERLCTRYTSFTVFTAVTFFTDVHVMYND